MIASICYTAAVLLAVLWLAAPIGTVSLWWPVGALIAGLACQILGELLLLVAAFYEARSLWGDE